MLSAGRTLPPHLVRPGSGSSHAGQRPSHGAFGTRSRPPVLVQQSLEGGQRGRAASVPANPRQRPAASTPEPQHRHHWGPQFHGIRCITGGAGSQHRDCSAYPFAQPEGIHHGVLLDSQVAVLLQMPAGIGQAGGKRLIRLPAVPSPPLGPHAAPSAPGRLGELVCHRARTMGGGHRPYTPLCGLPAPVRPPALMSPCEQRA